ncbi:hypothetical protein GS597_03585 [Synechococcales cyanobacterium C]|uniref:HNH endonuclease n=1 Tax=Petrachloros mirabilis ULC683 TaxID=2781853 RepID=A0A8K1ZXC0_9CYAN|nr:HNH endonuclease signature motif containing protein [Petrachloros mirabilis]NCJ05603.1 hypothetical protein [Petrachloros mirabilis ULC683]
MAKTPRIPIPAPVRQYVLERDQCRCRSCGQSQTASALEIDHIVPLPEIK